MLETSPFWDSYCSISLIPQRLYGGWHAKLINRSFDRERSPQPRWLTRWEDHSIIGCPWSTYHRQGPVLKAVLGKLLFEVIQCQSESRKGKTPGWRVRERCETTTDQRKVAIPHWRTVRIFISCTLELFQTRVELACAGKLWETLLRRRLRFVRDWPVVVRIVPSTFSSASLPRAPSTTPVSSSSSSTDAGFLPTSRLKRAG